MDKIGWRRFMEGMISGKVVAIQKEFVAAGGCNLSLENWTTCLVIKLLEVTHRQWLYRNVVVHDLVGRLEAVKRKQEPQVEIERVKTAWSLMPRKDPGRRCHLSRGSHCNAFSGISL